ncbi:MAG TPA: zinc ribbon domain-containing protein [Dehalococcoidales bacterium]|nr:zinc ribbon domain-containing protein [Dehalococcoidales bacterium]
MVTGRNFCSNCGKPVGTGDKFCGNCGKELTAAASSPSIAAAPPSVPDSTPSEPVIGAIGAARKTGMFSQESVHIIVTPRRLIIAAFTNEMIKQAAKEEGKSGLLSGMIGAATLGYSYYKRYLTMPPEEALKENSQNFSLEKGAIRKARLELGKRRLDQGRRVDIYEHSKLEIESSSQKYTFLIPNNFHNMASSVLKQAGLV